MKLRQMLLGGVIALVMGMWQAPAQAQAPAWQAIYYTRTPDNQFTLYSVTADGVTELPLPDGLSTLGSKVTLRDISPDRSTLFGIADNRLFLADLAAQTCCTMVEVVLEDNTNVDLNTWKWGEDGGFNADGSLVAITFGSGSVEEQEQLGIVDVASGSVSLWRVPAAADEVQLRLGGWDGQDVLVMPVQYCTEFCGQGPYQAITLGTEITVTNGVEFRSNVVEATRQSQYELVPFGQQLPTTLEIVSAKVTDSWQGTPLTIDTDGPFTFPNTLVYQQTVIHYDPSRPYMNLMPTWVADGRAVLAGNVLVWRTGQRQRIEVIQVGNVGTPDGWLQENVVSTANVRLQHISATPDGLVVRELGQFSSLLLLLDAPVLGASLATPPPPFAPLADPTAVLPCPNNLPPRLIVQQQGVTLPGPANNVRSQPNTSAEQVGQLAAGAQFTVVGGPICADGFTWWRVAQNDTNLGWTAEGDADYWLGPLG
jgi:Bacterial SH3 domain